MTGVRENQIAAWEQAAVALYAFSGGLGDAIGYLLARSFTGHVTGNLVLLALSVSQLEWTDVLRRLVAVIAFLAATGLGFQMSSSREERAPWLLFWAQCLLITTICIPAIRHAHGYPLLLIVDLCLVLGLQNGVVTSAGGVSVHATFLSGDLTTFIKKLVGRGKSGDSNKTRRLAEKDVLIYIVVSFVLGATCAGIAAGKLGSLVPLTLILPLCAAAVLSAMHNKAQKQKSLQSC